MKVFEGKNRPQPRYLLECVTRVKIACDKHLRKGHECLSSAWSDRGSCKVWVAPGKGEGKPDVQHAKALLQVTETLWSRVDKQLINRLEKSFVH